MGAAGQGKVGSSATRRWPCCRSGGSDREAGEKEGLCCARLRLLRGGPGTQDHAAPRGALVAGIRAGEAIDPATWKKPGLSGLAALEVGRAGRLEDLDAVLALSVTGPTPADRLAGLWAGLLLAPPETWANSEARDRATALQGAASR